MSNVNPTANPGRMASSASGLALAALLAFLPGQASAQEDRNSLFLEPTRADAAKAFALKVVSYRYNCGATYTDKTISRTGTRIAVRYAVKENPAAICPLIDRPYGPEFAMGALPAGRYEVHATPLLPCQVAPQPCEVPEKEERVGILTVGQTANADWFIQPSTVQAGKDFTLRILSEKYGNCQTTFSHSTQGLQDNRIMATFTTVTNPGIDCIVDIRPHGPSYALKGLKAGSYPVAVVEIPACAYDPQPCPMIPPIARIVDTLVVTGTTGVEPARRAASAAGRPKAAFTGGHFQVTLPEGTGPRGAESADLQGRALKVLKNGEAAP